MENSQFIFADLDEVPHGIFFSFLFWIFDGLLLFLALLYHSIDIALFATILLLLTIGLKCWSRFSTKKLVYQIVTDKQRVFPGEKVALSVIIENNKILPVIVKIRLLLNKSLVSDPSQASVKEDTGILWFQKLYFDRELQPQKRGVHETGSSRLISGDYFGFFPKISAIEQSSEIIVYPRIIPLRPFPILKKIMFGKQATVSPLQDPIYILGTREYQHFSPSRNIHWKVSARLNNLQEKIFEPTEQEKILLVLNADEFDDINDEVAFEKTVEAIASLAIELQSHHYATGFFTNCHIKDHPSNHLSVSRSPGQLSVLLEILARLEFRLKSQPLNPQEIKNCLPLGASIIYFSKHPVAEDSPILRMKSPIVNIVAETDQLLSANAAKNPSLVPLYTLNHLCLDS